MMLQKMCKLIVGAYVLLALSDCGPRQMPVEFRQEGMMLCETVRETWTKEPAPENILYINSDKTQGGPPQLRGLMLRPTTSFDYLYVRTTLTGDPKQPMRSVNAFFVIRDLSTGARLRGTVRDAWSNVEPISRYHWEGLASRS